MIFCLLSCIPVLFQKGSIVTFIPFHNEHKSPVIKHTFLPTMMTCVLFVFQQYSVIPRRWGDSKWICAMK